MTDDRDYDALAAKLAEVTASSQGWIDTAVEQQVRRKRAEARLLEVDEARDAVLAEAERVARYESDIAQQALDQMRAAEAALPAVYRLAMEKCEAACQIEIDRGDKNNASAYAVGARSCQAAIRALPTPTAAELMARIQTGEKE